MNTEQFDGHTPGPWDLIANYSEAEWDNTWEGAVHLFITLGLGIDRENLSVADARLIAAAPELLAEVMRLRQAFLIATGHVGYGNHLGHNELRHALNSVGIDADSLSWADGEWSEEE